MKTNKILLTVLLTAVPLFGFAQEWDDIYADPTRSEPVRVQKQLQEPQKKKVVIVQGDASNMEVVANGRDVDEYNRRGGHRHLVERSVLFRPGRRLYRISIYRPDCAFSRSGVEHQDFGCRRSDCICG